MKPTVAAASVAKATASTVSCKQRRWYHLRGASPSRISSSDTLVAEVRATRQREERGHHRKPKHDAEPLLTDDTSHLFQVLWASV